MHCSGCETRIKQNIRFVKGVKKIETSVPQQKVTIVYNNSKTGYADFVKAFDKIGYAIKKKKWREPETYFDSGGIAFFCLKHLVIQQ